MDDSDIKQVLADNLASLMEQRLDLGSQPKLASKSGVGQTTIGRILRKETSATIDNLKLLADAFRIPAYELLKPRGGDEAVKPGEESPRPTPNGSGNLYVDLILKECKEVASAYPDRLQAALGILNGTVPLPSSRPNPDSPELNQAVMAEVDKRLAAMVGRVGQALADGGVDENVGAKILGIIDRRKSGTHDPPPGQPERRAKS